MLKRSPNHISVLQREVSVVEEHFDCSRNCCWTKVVHCCQHPYGLCQHEMRHPRPFGDESLRCGHLLGVIWGREPHQNIGINGAHNAPSCSAVPPPSALQASEAAVASGTKLGAHPPRCSGPLDGL